MLERKEIPRQPRLPLIKETCQQAGLFYCINKSEERATERVENFGKGGVEPELVQVSEPVGARKLPERLKIEDILSSSFGISDSFVIIAKTIDIIGFLLGKIYKNPNSGTTEITNFSDSFGIFCNSALHKGVRETTR